MLVCLSISGHGDKGGVRIEHVLGSYAKAPIRRWGIPTSIALDITFSGCYFAGYNRRMFGSLAIHQAQKFAQFSLMGHHITPLFASYFFDVKGALRR